MKTTPAPLVLPLRQTPKLLTNNGDSVDLPIHSSTVHVSIWGGEDPDAPVSTWSPDTCDEQVASFSSRSLGNQLSVKPGLSSAKSTGGIKKWFFRKRRTEPSEPMHRREAETDNIAAHSSYSTPNLTIEPPQLTLEDLAKIDAFFAPTPILPDTPAPHAGKVYPPWSPDIDYRFRPGMPARSASLRLGKITVRTASDERGCSRAESIKRIRMQGGVVSASDTETRVRPRPMPRGRSETAESWRQMWVYGKGDELYSNIDADDNDNKEQSGEASRDTEEQEPPSDVAPQQDESLYFTIGESPIIDTDEITLRFIESPFEAQDPDVHDDELPDEPHSPSPRYHEQEEAEGWKSLR
ncbi:hypothetical protein AX17_006521 [Amanita inopinata Kibby_2008]|nr:hypothetical protein AX17_006521 [Amanita inopinata Kibby_2008]